MTNSAEELVPLLSLLDGGTPIAQPKGGWDNLGAEDRTEQEAVLAAQIRGRVSYFKQSIQGAVKTFVEALLPHIGGGPKTDAESEECGSNTLVAKAGSTPAVSIFESLQTDAEAHPEWVYPNEDLMNDIQVEVKSRLKFLPLCVCVMSSLHTQEYTPYWVTGSFTPENRPSRAEGLREWATKRKMESWLGAAELAALLVVPVGTDDIEYKSGASLTAWLNTGKDNGRLLKRWFANPGDSVNLPPSGAASPEERLAILYNYCPKYVESIRQILCSWKGDSDETKKIFVFNRMVEGGAARAFAMLLETFGYEDYTFGSKDLATGTKRKTVRFFPGRVAPRFVLLTGKTPVSKSDVLALYNSPENATGKFIQVVIGSEAIKQGFNILDVQEMHVLAPPWNYSGLDQAMGRIVRHGSHAEIDKVRGGATKVAIRLFAAVPFYSGDSSDTYLNLPQWETNGAGAKEGGTNVAKRLEALRNLNSVDIKKFYDLQNKDRAIKRMERLVKENAVDCPLFYERNRYRPADDNSRDCEYSSCSYQCSGMTEEEMAQQVRGYDPDGHPDAGLEEREIKHTNFDVLYARGLRSLIAHEIHVAFQRGACPRT